MGSEPGVHGQLRVEVVGLLEGHHHHPDALADIDVVPHGSLYGLAPVRRGVASGSSCNAGSRRRLGGGGEGRS